MNSVGQTAQQHDAGVIHVANLAASGASPVTGSLAGGSPVEDNLLAGGSPVVRNLLAVGLEGNPAPQTICSTTKARPSGQCCLLAELFVYS